MSCYDCKHYEPWGGLGDIALQHYCGKDGQIGVRCNPSESENCNGYKPRKEVENDTRRGNTACSRSS